MATLSINPVSEISRDNDVVTCEIFIAAPRERVFQALTDPKQGVTWWGQKETCCFNEFHMDVRPGGKWSSTGVSAKSGDFRVDGEFLEVDPPRRLAYTWNPTWMPKSTKVVWDLSVKDGGTFVKLTHTGFAGDADQAQGHNNGWSAILANLQTYVERGETV